MSEEWVKIYTSQDFYKSEIVKQVLIDNGIEAVILNKKGYPYQIGEVEVHIRQQDFQRAIEIIIAGGL